jgi:hypothetical protein
VPVLARLAVPQAEAATLPELEPEPEPVEPLDEPLVLGDEEESEDEDEDGEDFDPDDELAVVSALPFPARLSVR